MNKNTSGAVLVLILAAAGLFYDKPTAWALAALTAALAFLAWEFGEHASRAAQGIGVVLALLSWVTVACAALSLAN